MQLTIRPATPADAPVIVEFNRLLAQETEGKALDPDILGRGVAAALADPDNKGPYFLAEDGGAVIGQMQITFEWTDWRNGWFWWIQGVYVREEARGRGVFRALYRHIYEAARANPNVVGLRLYVERENHAAQDTYRKLGMEPASYLLFQRWPLR